MSNIVDRRLNGKNKSTVNRQRYINRANKHIAESVQKRLEKDGDINNRGKVDIPAKDVSEPIFHHGGGGRREHVLPGNKDFIKGDKIKRPEGGQGDGKGGGKSNGKSKRGSKPGEGDSDATEQVPITEEEFLDFAFDGLELRNLDKKSAQARITKSKLLRGGYKSDGNPTQISVVKSLQKAQPRRNVFRAGKEKKLIKLFNEAVGEITDQAALENAIKNDAAQTIKANLANFPIIFPQQDTIFKKTLERLKENFNGSNFAPDTALSKYLSKPSIKTSALLKTYHDAADDLSRRYDKISFIDDVDMVFKNKVEVERPSSDAVVIFIRDVSQSMAQAEREICKKYGEMQEAFLDRQYGKGKVERRYITHTDKAKEVGADDFHNSQETGSTYVASALELAEKMVMEDYAHSDTNIYIVQMSDGDVFSTDDSTLCREIYKKLFPYIQHATYVEVRAANKTGLLSAYFDTLRKNHAKDFDMHKINNVSEIYPTFRKVHEKRSPAALEHNFKLDI